jgi:hypothetical protein
MFDDFRLDEFQATPNINVTDVLADGSATISFTVYNLHTRPDLKLRELTSTLLHAALFYDKTANNIAPHFEPEDTNEEEH